MLNGANDELLERWQAAWPQALALWNRFTQLSTPRWCISGKEEQAEHLTTSFAMIRLVDHAVVISLRQVAALKLERFAVEVLAHEIGHHIYCPADLNDQGRMLARISAVLAVKRDLSPFIANLYADLLINDRLQRNDQLDLAGLYRTLRGDQKSEGLWSFYMRTYEVLWKLERGALTGETVDEATDFDARLAARLIRHYSKHWLDGAGRYAVLCLRYLLQEEETRQSLQIFSPMHDTKGAGKGGLPSGLTEIEAEESSGAVHPALDEELTGLGKIDDQEESAADGKERDGKPNSISDPTSPGNSGSQYREPFEYGEILKNLGIKLTREEMAIRYYRERAIPHLIPFPSEKAPESKEPLAEGLVTWDAGSPLENIDWVESVIASPHVVPGVTTVERYHGMSPGREPEVTPLDLDLYVDSSGSMPNPQVQTSYLTLAGAIVVLSALRAGARVQATLWSGTREFLTTDGFITDEHKLLSVLTGYFGGSTAFPIHILRDTFSERRPGARPVHIMVISDDGVTTMFDKDERKNSGWDVARMALEKGRAGGTLVLNLWNDVSYYADLRRAQGEGWDVHRVQTWEQLVTFAREFSKRTYGTDKTQRR